MHWGRDMSIARRGGGSGVTAFTLLTDAASADIPSINSLVAPRANPTFTGTVTVPTASQADNSTKAASTAYVDTLGATKADVLSEVTIGAGTTAITRASHLNRPCIVNQGSGTTGTFAATATSNAVSGDTFYLQVAGAGTFTATGAITASAGYKLSADTGEVFAADYDSVSDSFKSRTPDLTGLTGASIGVAMSANYAM